MKEERGGNDGSMSMAFISERQVWIGQATRENGGKSLQ